MSTSPPTAGGRGGLSNAIDIVIAPNAAFDRLRETPTWLWAFAVALVCGIIGTLVAHPAFVHAFDTSMPAQLAADPNIAKLPPEQQQRQIAMVMGISRFMFGIAWLFVPFAILIGGLIQGLVLTIENAIGRGQGSFAKFFALSVTASVVGIGLYYLAFAAIVMVRGPSSFETMSALQNVVPGLALLAPGAHGFLAGFLGALSVFTLWATALLALGTIRIAHISPVLAWSGPVVLLLIGALFAGFGARNG